MSLPLSVWLSDGGNTYHRLTCERTPSDFVTRALVTVPVKLAHSWQAKPCADCRPDIVIPDLEEPTPAAG